VSDDQRNLSALTFASTFNPGGLSDEDVNAAYWMLGEERRLRGLTSTSDWPVPRDSVGLMLDRAIRAMRVKNAALETVRVELDLPEHLAEIVGAALAKDAGRAS
jgi:hypothetical protein